MASAESLFQQAIRSAPEEPNAIRLLGEVLIDSGRTGEAIALLQRLVKLWPKQFTSHYSLGNAYRHDGRYEMAIACYRQVLALEPRFAGAHHGLGMVLRSLEREREALKSLRQAVHYKSDWPVAWKDLGLTFAMLGDLPMAEYSLKRAVLLEPSLGDAQRHLAAIRQDIPEKEEMAVLTYRAVDPRISIVERIDLLFTLGRLADKACDFDMAFTHVAAANALLREQMKSAGTRFDRVGLRRVVDTLIAVFSSSTFEDFRQWGDPCETPVFIVGMPRAGSTLVEQIAATHKQVFGAGESSTIPKVADRIGSAPSGRWTKAGISAGAMECRAAMQGLAGDVARVIDKMPNNILLLGLIAVLFPRARVIFCDRDLPDLALSCFFQNFTGSDGFDTDISDICFRNDELQRLKAHWLSVLPLRCMTVRYEKLLDDPEGESRRLIRFLDLEWDTQCLSFYETQRIVRTASWAQVRQPLYHRSRGHWKNYEKHLGEALRGERTPIWINDAAVATS